MSLDITINLENRTTVEQALSKIYHFIQSPEFMAFNESGDLRPTTIQDEQSGKPFLYKESSVFCYIEEKLKPTYEFYMNDSEANFYAYVMEDIRHHSIVETICLDLISKRKACGHYCKFYSNEEVSFGLYPAFFLAAQDKKFIYIFIDMLKTFDMDHEVYENTCIRYLVDKHQRCEPILSLLAARITSCCGQFGFEDMHYMQEDLKLDQYFDNAPGKTRMTDGLIKEFVDGHHQRVDRRLLTVDQDNHDEILSLHNHLKNYHIVNWIDALTEEFDKETWPNLSEIIYRLKTWSEEFEPYTVR